jgi:hypothetical protein
MRPAEVQRSNWTTLLTKLKERSVGDESESLEREWKALRAFGAENIDQALFPLKHLHQQLEELIECVALVAES